MTAAARFVANARRIAPLAWPVFVGQLSVLMFSTVDTVLVARHGASDLAALAVGTAAYVTTFVGFMGVMLAVGPIVAALHGAGRHADVGRELHQATWIALALGAAGSALLVWPEPFLALARADADVAARVRGYLLALAFALPAVLLFTVFRSFSIAISNPKPVMALQIGALAAKVPLSAALVFGWPALGIPALGVVGCGIATACVVWLQLAGAAWLLRRRPRYAPYALAGRGLDAPAWERLAPLLRLGVPIGLGMLVEVSGFTFMAIFIARLGATPVAGHQIAVNVVSMLFMMPLGIANGCGTLVAQRLGAQDGTDARRLGWDGVALGGVVALVFGVGVYTLRGPLLALYTRDAGVVAAALPLLAFVALFHVADAVQTVAAFVLRAHRIATAPLVVNAVALWGVGLGGGYALAFGAGVPAALHGARGFWLAATVGLVMTALLLVLLLARRVRLEPRAGLC